MKDRIAAVCQALGLAATPAQVDALAQYLDLLLRWNRTYNLTSIRDADEALTLHLADCLAVVGPLARVSASGRLLDVGSGGGLPGVVLAVMLPSWDVTCCDTVGKKAAFVTHVAGALSLRNLHAEHARVEQLKRPPFDVIASRAFASLADFAALTRPLLAPGGRWLAMKGKRPEDEIAGLDPAVEMFHVEQLTVPGLEAERCIVWMAPKLR